MRYAQLRSTIAAVTNMRPTRRVLVVDDNLDTVQSLAILLREKGYDVQLAIDGRAAIEVARHFRPHVVVLDLGLPDSDGLQVARQLRRLPNGKGMRILALTGRKHEGDSLRSFQAGCDHHLLKPLHPRILENFLDEAR
jgi:two-component system CheB/CheR fusion protein